jgi:hypothetical protein
LFTSPKDPTDEGTTPNTFQQITHLICDTDAETVFFAGRHTQLRQFINALGAARTGRSPCSPVTRARISAATGNSTGMRCAAR